jgi:type VI secretion system ImpM family protein
VTGFFGKIPAHGDFVTRNVADEFLDTWDPWLQRALARSKERLGDSWLDIYLTSPIWRFVLPGGVCGRGGHVGILVPSVDRVGRYFPLTFVTAVDGDVNPFHAAAAAEAWFAAAESLALTVLNSPHLDADELAGLLQQVGGVAVRSSAAEKALALDSGRRAHWCTGLSAVEIAGALADASVRQRMGTYSVWWTTGSGAPPLTLLITGLPDPEDFSEVLAGVSSRVAEPSAAPPRLSAPWSEPGPGGRFKWSSVSRSETGNVRDRNEDACVELPSSGLWAVADGLGGHADGEVASQMLVDALRGTAVSPSLSALVDDVEDRVLDTNHRLYERSQRSDGRGLVGCTVAALLAHGSHCVGLWAGDSRIYRLRDGTLTRITHDHSEAEEARSRGGAVASTENNAITRAVGAAEQLFLGLDVCRLQNGDRFLICSDGLYRELLDDELRDHLADGDCAGACASLFAAALRRECADNVTAVVVDFTDATG